MQQTTTAMSRTTTQRIAYPSPPFRDPCSFAYLMHISYNFDVLQIYLMSSLCVCVCVSILCVLAFMYLRCIWNDIYSKQIILYAGIHARAVHATAHNAHSYLPVYMYMCIRECPAYVCACVCVCSDDKDRLFVFFYCIDCVLSL